VKRGGEAKNEVGVSGDDDDDDGVCVEGKNESGNMGM
jgi:hypothetical protein